ncbi:MAG: DUF488 domain-containing protein [Pyrinomonadaceae bacterium]|nr:DUF488 domain-containing protein [Pyrinomonadaceae bacterium]
MASENNGKLWTIGHSTRNLEEFIGLLQKNGIKTLADVRRFPGSRKFPHFNQDELRESLHEAGINYQPMPDLGGRRRAKKDSKNTAWRNESFRGYADYMETDQFRSAAAKLENLAGENRTAVMCAEVLWWRCHRALIADFFKAKGASVYHIFTEDKVEEHKISSAGEIVNGKLDYTAKEKSQ